MEEKEYKRPYLINNVTGDVVSVQDKAWNDSVCTCLYVDVLLGPTKEKLGKLFLVWDSCGPHTVQAVKDVFAEWGIDVAQLPVRMTSLLQIMDLVVNGPVKAAVRDARCQQLVGHLRAFLAARKLEDDKPVAERVYAPFSPPPKPTQTQGLMTVMRAVRDMSMDAEFRAGMQRSFVNCCQAPDPDRMARGMKGVEQFRPYPASHADMKVLSNGYMGGLKHAADSLADVFAQISFVDPRTAADDAADALLELGL